MIDRFLQQAIAQIFNESFDSTFSPNSYGFQPNKRGHDAVRQARIYMEQGYRWVVDIDLEKFFDKVNHDKLMRTLSQRVEDGRVLQLIRRYLQAGVMERGLLFVRYADDCNIYVRSKRAGERIMQNMTMFIEKKLKLKVNHEKSAVDRPWKRKFLGFTLSPHRNPQIRISKQSIQRLKQRIRGLTSRKWSISMEERIKKLNRYLVGWLGYYQLAETPSVFRNIDAWIRRRLRMIRWKEWKKVGTKLKNLTKLGILKSKAWEWANSRKGYWRIAKSPILDRALDNQYLVRTRTQKSVDSISNITLDLDETAVYGTVCTVV